MQKKSTNNTKNLVDKAIQQSIAFHQQGRIKEALKITEQGLEQAPNNITLLTNAGAFASMLGQLELAKKCILSSLKINPNYVDAHYNLALLFETQKQLEKAKEHYQIALKLNPNYVNAHYNLALLFKTQKQLEKAKEHYQIALKLNPNYAEAHNNLGLLFQTQKHFEKAKEHYQIALKLNPNDVKAHYNFANLLKEQKQLEKAKEHYQIALKLNPNYVDAHYNLGNLFNQQKQFEKAKEHYQIALKLNPNHADAHNNLGNLFREQKQFEKAKEHYQIALKLNPNDAGAHNNLGILFQAQKHFEKAKEHYQVALKLNPNYVEAYNNLGSLFQQQKHFDKAKEHYQIALKLNPNYVEAYNNLGSLFQQQKHFDKAKEHYQIALKLNPNYVDAQWNLSVLQLRLSNFSQGWQGYESRYHPDRKDRNAIPPKTLIPQYQGEDLTGKNILVCLEQGFGDEIQFIRYLPLLKKDKGVKNIVLVCKPALKKLFASMTCIDKVISRNDFADKDVQNIDYWVFIMSLPLHFNTTLKTIPNHLPYLTSSKENQNQWQDKLPKDFNNSFNIGLVWKGSKTNTNDENRSLPSIKPLKPLWKLQNKISKNLNFISLQKGEGEDEAQNPPTDQPIIHLGTEIQDFADSAAVVSQLDLVISVDTAIVHLAGSLNIPCWVLLPDYNADWRWLVDRDDSPWYPNSMRLFRQTNDDDWDEVIERVVEALAEG